MALPEERWKTCNKGKQIDDYYLRDHLKDFLTKDKRLIKEHRRPRRGSSPRKHGYHEVLFEEAFASYLGKPLPSSVPSEDDDPPPGSDDSPDDPPSSKHEHVVQGQPIRSIRSMRKKVITHQQHAVDQTTLENPGQKPIHPVHPMIPPPFLRPNSGPIRQHRLK
jgi:hypothetical protein